MSEPLRVLFVEDSEDDLALLLRELRRGGYEPSHRRVETELALRAALETQPWDLILSDFSMPRFDGIAAFEIARRQVPETPFIFVSGRIGEERAVDAMRRGVKDYVLKDNLRRLVPAIRRELEEARRRGEGLRAQEALEASEEKYKQLVEGSIQGISIVQQGKIVYSNPAHARMLGYADPAELVGTDAIAHVHPEDRHEALHTGGPPRHGAKADLYRHYRGLRKDGSVFWYEANTAMTAWQGQRALQWTLIDVTERRRAEEQLRQAQKMEAVGQLTGGVAHDFNNILTVILSASDFVLAKLGATNPAREDVRMIQDAGRRATALTRQLLAFSRHQVLRLQTVNLNGLATEMSTMLRRLIGEHIEVALHLRADPADLRADPSQLEQVILNLAVNARDAMPRGGALTIETENQVLEADHAGVAPGPYVVLTVSDTGTGMDEETLPKIFDPFFTTKPAGLGTGLGLATVYGIVKQMNGSVLVYSEPGRGSTFKLYLPASADTPVAAALPLPTVAAPRPTECVLLVEDDALVRRSAERILTGAGYTVVPAAGPDEALEVAAQYAGPLHLLLSDVVMPGGTGPEMWVRLQAVRQRISVGSGEPTPLPALFMSGYTGDADTRQGLLEGDLPFLAKPFSSEDLLKKVREVLHASRP